MGSADGERCLDTTGETISLHTLGGCDNDEIDQILDSGVLVTPGQRVSVQLLGEGRGTG
jgi:hypothetical protein